MARDRLAAHLHFYRPAPLAVSDLEQADVQRLMQTIPLALFQLPPDVANFTGRQAKVDDAIALFKQIAFPLSVRSQTTSILAIVGRAGVGKSALAIHIAHRLKSDFTDVLLINLRGTEEQPLQPTEVLSLCLQHWGVEQTAIPDTLEQRSQLLRSVGGDQRIVIVLDNVRDEAQIMPLIEAISAGAILITSRKRLTNLPDVHLVDLAEMAEIEALVLLQTLSGCAIAQSDIGTSAVNLCSRLPLTLCMAGHWLRYMTERLPKDRLLKDYVEQLTEERRRIKPLHLSHADVRACFMLSYRQLDPLAARLFRLLGLLADNSFSSALAEILLEADCKSALEQLVKLKFLEAVSVDRYRFAHELMRLLARGQLATEETMAARSAARLRVCLWYQRRAEQVDSLLDAATRQQWAIALRKNNRQSASSLEQRLWIEASNWFETERFNLLATVVWAQQAEAWELLLRLVDAQTSFLSQQMYGADLQQTQVYALEAARQLGDRQREAQLLTNLGNANFYLQQHERARECYMLSLRIFSQLGDSWASAQALMNLGLLCAQQGQIENAMTHWKTAIATLSADTNEQRKLVRQMQVVDRSLWQQVVTELSELQSRSFLQTISEKIKRLIRED